MSLNAMAKIMTPELLWKLGRVTPGISKDGKYRFTK
jgi:hypothetical protein